MFLGSRPHITPFSGILLGSMVSRADMNEVYAELPIPSTPEKPSRIPMWKGALGAYFINAFAISRWPFLMVFSLLLLCVDLSSWFCSIVKR
ncbi:hypothetical protein ACFX2A_014689 [Malus domestica]